MKEYELIRFVYVHLDGLVRSETTTIHQQQILIKVKRKKPVDLKQPQPNGKENLMRFRLLTTALGRQSNLTIFMLGFVWFLTVL